MSESPQSTCRLADDVPSTSFASDARGFDDGPPFLDLGSLQRGEYLRRHLIAWKQHTAERGKPFADGRVVYGRDNRGIELVDDGFGRALWRPYAAPDRAVKTRQACLVDTRNLRCAGQPVLRHHRIGFDRAALNL